MKFSIGLTLDAVSFDETIRTNKSSVVYDFGKNIIEYIKKLDYGEGIVEYAIKLYIVNPPIGFEHLFKDFKPKFIEHKLIPNKYTGEKLELNKYFNYSIKITGDLYNKFLTGTVEESEKILATEILNSLSNLDALPKKIKDFDKERFKADMEQFFKAQKLV
jgi:hypothetical protein